VNDQDIVDRFWARSESAISAVSEKYSQYLRCIASNILGNADDVDEVINDTYHRLWTAIPPNRPENLRAFSGRITRNLSLDRVDTQKAEKRGGGHYPLILAELEECVGDKKDFVDDLADSESITTALNLFLSQLSAEKRRVFVRRYWRAASIDEIAEDFGMSVGKVKTILFRTRKDLRKYLESEGIHL